MEFAEILIATITLNMKFNVSCVISCAVEKKKKKKKNTAKAQKKKLWLVCNVTLKTTSIWYEYVRVETSC